MGAMDLRTATAKDRSFLEQMLVVAVHWRPGAVLPPVEEVLADAALARYVEGWPRGGEPGVVAEEDGEPVGAAWCRSFTADGPGYGFVGEDVPEVSVGVVEAARGRGVGRALMTAVIDAARQQGFDRLSLSVEDDNRAKRLYEELGFVTVGRSDGASTMVRVLG
jgi:ribosomal protein S18 acetylase RimI-like enzyme